MLSPDQPSTKTQRQRLGILRGQLWRACGIAVENYRDLMEGRYGVRSAVKLTVAQASEFIQICQEVGRMKRSGASDKQIRVIAFWARKVRPDADTLEVLSLVEGVLHMHHPTIFSLQNLDEKQAENAIYGLKAIARRENQEESRKADHHPRVTRVDFKKRRVIK